MESQRGELRWEKDVWEMDEREGGVVEMCRRWRNARSVLEMCLRCRNVREVR